MAEASVQGRINSVFRKNLSAYLLPISNNASDETYEQTQTPPSRSFTTRS